MTEAVATDRRLLALSQDPETCATVCLIARSVGYQARSTSAHERFLAELAVWAPSWVIVDLGTPQAHEAAILEPMAAVGSPASVIVMVAGSADGRNFTASGLKVVAVLPKPFPAHVLRELLAAGLAAEPPSAAGPRPARSSTLEISPDTLRTALESRALEAWYQPKLSCASKSLVGFEALARWPDPNFGMIMPAQFIPVAERAGLIDRLTRQVVENALSWFALPFRDSRITLAINLSALLLADPDLPSWLFECCSKFAVDPGQIILEVTESEAIRNQHEIVGLAMQLRLHGFRFCIDDFGVGYSSLSQLAGLPFSELKIDRSLVMQASTSEKARRIISSVIGLAQALDLQVTAEGVEDQWTLDFLHAQGCDAIQGYLIARPMDGPHALAWYEANAQASGALAGMTARQP